LRRRGLLRGRPGVRRGRGDAEGQHRESDEERTPAHPFVSLSDDDRPRRGPQKPQEGRFFTLLVGGADGTFAEEVAFGAALGEALGGGAPAPAGGPGLAPTGDPAEPWLGSACAAAVEGGASDTASVLEGASSTWALGSEAGAPLRGGPLRSEKYMMPPP